MLADQDTEAPCGLSLTDLARGTTGTITAVGGDPTTRRRLQELGLLPGTAITMIRKAPLRDPIEFRVRGYHLSLRATQAALVAVVLAGDDHHPTASKPSSVVSNPAPMYPATRPLVALVGNPNAGKTTLFNRITGLHQKVGNYPGVTVDRCEGTASLASDITARLVDLPGTYSLTPTSPDERIAIEAVTGQVAGLPAPDVVCAVVDATNLTRNLLLVTQLLETGRPLVVALTMSDLARSQGLAIDCQTLALRLGVPVIPVVATTGEGLVALRQALASAARRLERAPWTFPAPCDHAACELAGVLADCGIAAGDERDHERLVLARNLLASDELLSHPTYQADERIAVAVHRLRKELAAGGIDPATADIQARYAWIDAVVTEIVGQNGNAAGHALSRRVDQVLLHPVFGLGVFAAVMWAVFTVIFTLADPLMGLAEAYGMAALAWVGAFLPAGLLQSLWADGIVAGVGGVVVFVPQIALMMLLIALLEQSGYLARASFLLDRVLAAVGLHGKSFVPMLTSHACAIPGIMASRTIEHPRDRLATMLVAPFMACGARLPVYVLLVGMLFGAFPPLVQGTVMFALYSLGIIAAAVVAWLLKRTALGGRGEGFMIELPSYRLPQWRAIVRVVAVNTGHFLKKAGTIILAFAILLWAALTFPGLPEERQAVILDQHGVVAADLATDAPSPQALAARNAISAAQAEHSLAGRFGKAIEPVIAPLGYDWKIGIGLVGAFAAREVFVSTMGIVYGAGEVEDETTGLEQRMLADTRADGSPRFSFLLGISLLVWFALAMQCISTVATMVRETKGWRWPLLQLVGMNTLAYVVCLAIWQVGSRL